MFACFYTLSAKRLYAITDAVIFIAKIRPLQERHTRQCRQQGVVVPHLACRVFPKAIPKAQSCFGEFSFLVITEPHTATVPQGDRWGEVLRRACECRSPGKRRAGGVSRQPGRDQTCFPSRRRAEHPRRAASDVASPQ